MVFGFLHGRVTKKSNQTERGSLLSNRLPRIFFMEREKLRAYNETL